MSSSSRQTAQTSIRSSILITNTNSSLIASKFTTSKRPPINSMKSSCRKKINLRRWKKKESINTRYRGIILARKSITSSFCRPKQIAEMRLIWVILTFWRSTSWEILRKILDKLSTRMKKNWANWDSVCIAATTRASQRSKRNWIRDSNNMSRKVRNLSVLSLVKTVELWISKLATRTFLGTLSSNSTTNKMLLLLWISK